MRSVMCCGPEEYRLEEITVPTISPGEVLVRILGAGICADDAIPYELGTMDDVRSDPERQREVIHNNTYELTRKTPPIELALQKWFGPARTGAVTYVEAFGIAEFGRQITDQEVLQLFPMLSTPPDA